MKTQNPTVERFGWQLLWLTVLRIGIGWHFLWEGWIKLAQPGWSAAGYLNGSWGLFSPIMHFIGQTDSLLGICNVAIPWALFLTGWGLMLGFLTRYAIQGAMGLLALFILATPAYEVVLTDTIHEWKEIHFAIQNAQWAGNHFMGTEGSYFLVTKNIVEFLALSVLLTLDAKSMFGIDYLMDRSIEQEIESEPKTV